MNVTLVCSARNMPTYSRTLARVEAAVDPDKPPRIGVSFLKVVIDFFDQALQAAKRPPTNGLLRSPVKPPGARGMGLSEAYVEWRLCCQPAFDLDVSCVP